MSNVPANLDLSKLSPFELKDMLIAAAKDTTQQKAATVQFLNAGRGNPNWIATTVVVARLAGEPADRGLRADWEEHRDDHPERGEAVEGIQGRMKHAQLNRAKFALIFIHDARLDERINSDLAAKRCHPASVRTIR
jgi:hypothetical protein